MGFFDKFKKRKKDKNARMVAVYASPDVMLREVYASPEVMSGRAYASPRPPRPVSNENNPMLGKYPFIHYAKRQKVFCIYCGGMLNPQSQICTICGKDNSEKGDSGVTERICQNCGAGIPCLSVYCSFCGRKL